MLTFALTAAALAQEAPPIVNGSETSDFPQVGALLAYDGRQGGVFCSGTLIHARWVLTAAHCIDGAEPYLNAGFDVYFLMGESAYSNNGIDEMVLVTDLIPHPQYNAQRLTADIGLLTLETEVDVQPVELNTQAPSNAWIGRELDYVGWGVTSDNGQGSGIKRHARIGYYDADSQFIYGYDQTSNLCSGDSGGASLYEVEPGVYELVGVNSFVFPVQNQSTSCEGGGSGATRVDAFHDWIVENVPVEENQEIDEPEDSDPIDEPEDTGDLPSRPLDNGEDKGTCASAPASGSLALALLGLLALRRRQT